MDDAGFESAHIFGNSLDGYLWLQLASRGRADRIVALVPEPAAGRRDDEPYKDTLGYFATMQDLLKTATLHAEAVVASRPAGAARHRTSPSGHWRRPETSRSSLSALGPIPRGSHQGRCETAGFAMSFAGSVGLVS